MIPDALTILTAVKDLGWGFVVLLILAAVVAKIYKKKILTYFDDLKSDVSVMAGALIDPRNGKRIIRRHDVLESLEHTEESLLAIREMLGEFIGKSCTPETCPIHEKLDKLDENQTLFREEAKVYRIAAHDHFNGIAERTRESQHEQAAVISALLAFLQRKDKEEL